MSSAYRLSRNSEITARYQARYEEHSQPIAGALRSIFRADFWVDGNRGNFWPQPGHRVPPGDLGFSIQNPNFQKLCIRNIVTVNQQLCVVDATGSLVRSIRRGPYKSGPIFLYLCVMTDAGKNGLPVLQMLSESHDSLTIQVWLSKWLLAGAPKPKQVISDFSLAILGAIVRTFTTCFSFKYYIEKCYRILMKITLTLPECFIRVDVAHLVKLVCNWKCLTCFISRAREFFIRCVVQILQSDSLTDIQELIRAILIMSLCNYEEKSASLQKDCPCEISKKWLKERISSNCRNDDCLMGLLGTEPTSVGDDFVQFADELADNSLSTWINSILEQVQTNLLDDGDRDNIQHLPAIVSPLLKLCYTIPVWTAVMVPVFKYGNQTASSAAVESAFNELKTHHLQKRATCAS
uniref:MULE transposase domain-containing protein n=1 Tax=Strigamia maritima TaxID=126957 RepID=T1JFD5_STRMM